MEGKVQDQYQKLQAAIPNLSEKDQEFAQSLLEWCETKGGWTPNQEKWVVILIGRAALNAAKPTPVIVDVGEFTGVVALFKKAKQYLKFPAIVLVDQSNGNEIKLTLASDASKNPGSVYVKVDGVYKGKVSPLGQFQPHKCSEFEGKWLQGLLEVLGKDPAGVAAKHGKMTGKCCFCNTKLTDPKSTSVGYGPVCAKHYGLPWGNTPLTNEYKPSVSTKLQMAAEHIAHVKMAQDFPFEPLGHEPGPADEAYSEAAMDDTPIQTHLDEPATQSPVAEPEEPAQEEKKPERVDFKIEPGRAVKNLLEALNGA